MKSARKVNEWRPVLFSDDGMTCSVPYEKDGCWILVTDGKSLSIERIKKDAYDHFYPSGRFFALEDTVAWKDLPDDAWEWEKK